MTQEEVKKMTWQVEAEHSIYDAVQDWNYHRFVCLMKDNTIQVFTGINDETYNGEINTYINCVSDDSHDNTDDILMWIEVPKIS